MNDSIVFYNNYIQPMIHHRFFEFEDRIAVGIAGEGSDCFGYDDFMSRDHDFGTGVCLWLTNDDFDKFGNLLSIAYNEIAMMHGANNLTNRLRERRGVMKIHDFYSNILNINCNTDDCIISDDNWRTLDHSCLATATNGMIFRDDLGQFSAYRNLLLNYYPTNIWIERLANALHQFSASLQVNYARCMCRLDAVAGEMCRSKGLEAAMEIYYLINRTYPPYYKWTFHKLKELDNDGEISQILEKISTLPIDITLWKDYNYNPARYNLKDEIVTNTEQLASLLALSMQNKGIVTNYNVYLETYVDKLLYTK